ncbi:hypothetical protein AZOA_12100 [Azoarcus sp. Aa7]|nr:hypothetical protein [Azoarcus sp. Aa7]
MSKSMMRKPTVAEFLTRKIDESSKTQKEIATEIGYENPNIITMFKNGSTKLPLNTVGPMALSLGEDPKYLLRLVMSEYFPATLAAVEDCLGTTILTAKEHALIEAIRRSSHHTDPSILVFEGKDMVGFTLA